MAWQRVFQGCLTVAAVFTASILAIGPALEQVTLLPDQGASWYYWKLPEATTMSRLSAWGGYMLHQLFIWWLIFKAKQQRQEMRKTVGLHWLNWLALTGTGGFILLHLVQTAVYYDGLAQDVSVFSSQASVVLLLVVVIIIEAPRRGLWFGSGGSWLAKTRPLFIQYHGYYFAWAITYTFWFHPMETSLGHLLGFFYTFLLFIQAGFVFTPLHTNRYWTLVLEVGVLIHGVTVALIAGQEVWPMFAFGFVLMFIITQMHGIGLSRNLRWAFAFITLVAIALVYQGRGWQHLHEIIRIPIIDYLLVLVIAGLVLLLQKTRRAA